MSIFRLNNMTVWSVDVASARHKLLVNLGELRIATEKEVGIITRQRAIEWRRQSLSRRGWLHQMRRNNHHKICFVFEITIAAEQRSQYRDRAKPGNLVSVTQVVCLQKSCNCKALAVSQFNRCDGIPFDQRRNRRTGNRNCIREVEFADFRRNSQVDDSVC